MLPSSSIALSQATHGNALNIVEKLTGRLLPFGETVFTAFNLIPTVLVVVIVPSRKKVTAMIQKDRCRTASLKV